MADMSETQIRSRFRFRRETIIFISNLLRNDLERPVNKKKSVHFCGNSGNFYFPFSKNTFKVCFVPITSQILMKMTASELR